jgi:hypothetical protein
MADMMRGPARWNCGELRPVPQGEVIGTSTISRSNSSSRRIASSSPEKYRRTHSAHRRALRHVADVRRLVSSHDAGMPVRRVMLAIALWHVVACSAPDVATPGLTDELAAPAAPATGQSSTLECPAGLGTVSAP